MAALEQAGVKVVPTGLAHGTVTAVVDGRGVRDHHPAPRRRNRRPPRRRRLHRRTGNSTPPAATSPSTPCRWRATARYSTISAAPPTCRPAASASSATRRPASPRTTCASSASSASTPATAGLPPDPATLDALAAGIPGLARLSIERVWIELRRILAAPDPGRSHRPDAAARHLGRRPAGGRRPCPAWPGCRADPVLRLAAMLTGDPLALATRLKMSNEDRDRLVRLAATPSARRDATPTCAACWPTICRRPDRPHLAR